MPFKTFANNDVLTAEEVNEYLMQQTVVRAASTAELNGLPAEVRLGTVGNNLYFRSAGDAWVKIYPTEEKLLFQSSRGDNQVIGSNTLHRLQLGTVSKNQGVTIIDNKIKVPKSAFFHVNASVTWSTGNSIIFLAFGESTLEGASSVTNLEYGSYLEQLSTAQFKMLQMSEPVFLEANVEYSFLAFAGSAGMQITNKTGSKLYAARFSIMEI